MYWQRVWALSFIGLMMLATACQASNRPGPTEKLHVVAATTIVGDVVRQIGGDFIQLTTLLPYGADPHSFEPTPQDVAKISEAELIFANGAGLELFLAPLLDSVGAQDKVIDLSAGVALRTLAVTPDAGTEADHPENSSGSDPHVWTDPNNVIIWADSIHAQLASSDPDHAADFIANATQFKNQLQQLDAWINDQVAQIPPSQRLIVTDHQVFGYFADAYGFTQAGTIVQGFSTLAEPSAQEIATLEDAIRQLGVRAIFVGNTVNPSLAKRIAEDTGVQLVTLYTGSLSSPDGEAATYQEYMRFNVTAMVAALR